MSAAAPAPAKLPERREKSQAPALWKSPPERRAVRTLSLKPEEKQLLKGFLHPAAENGGKAVCGDARVKGMSRTPTARSPSGMGLEAVRQMPQPGTSTVKSPVFLAAAIFLHPVSLAAATVLDGQSSFTPPAAEWFPCPWLPGGSRGERLRHGCGSPARSGTPRRGEAPLILPAAVPSDRNPEQQRARPAGEAWGGWPESWR